MLIELLQRMEFAAGPDLIDLLHAVGQLMERLTGEDDIIIVRRPDGFRKPPAAHVFRILIDKHDAVRKSAQPVLPVCIRLERHARLIAGKLHPAALLQAGIGRDHIEERGLAGAAVALDHGNVPRQLQVIPHPTVTDLDRMLSVHAASHILAGQKDKFPHIVRDLPIVHDPDLEFVFAKIHDMAEIDDLLLFLCHLQQPFGAVVAALGGVEHMPAVLIDEDERLHAAGKLRRRDWPQHGTLDQIGTFHLGLIHIADHLHRERVRDPLILVGMLEVS